MAESKSRLFVISTVTEGGIRIELRVSASCGRVGLITNVRTETVTQWENATVKRITERLKRNERGMAYHTDSFDRLVSMARDLAHGLKEFGYPTNRWSEAGDGAVGFAADNARRTTKAI